MPADIRLLDMEVWWPIAFAAVVVVLMAAAFLAIAKRFVGLFQKSDLEPVAERVDASPSRRTLLWVALAVLGSRALLYLWAWFIHCLSTGAWCLPWQSFGGIWVQWDAYHYLKLGRQWYTAPGVAGPNDHLMLVFFPMFPLLLRNLHAVFGVDQVAAAAALNLTCSIGAGCVLFRVTARHYGERKAWLALAYLLANPFSLFLGAPYPESLFLFLTLAAIDAANQRKYILAGLWGALSAYTRMLGLIVAGVILLEGLGHWLEARKTLAGPRDRRRLCVKAAGGAAVVGLGFAVYLLLNLQTTGAPFTFLEYQRVNWSQRFGSFWYSAYNTGLYMVRDFRDFDSFWGIWLPQGMAMVAVSAMLVARQGRLPLSWAAYAWVYLSVALAPTWLLSGSRYLMVLAVLPALQCVLSNRRWFHTVFLALQAVLLLVYTYLYAVERAVL